MELLREMAVVAVATTVGVLAALAVVFALVVALL